MKMGTVYAKDHPEIRNLTQEEWGPLDQPARVDKIHFDGIERTKTDVLKHVVSDLLKADTFEDIVLKAHGVRQQLETLQAFNRIDIILDTSQSSDASPNGYEVIFDVQERKKINGGIATGIGNNDANGIIQLQFPNMFGRGESLSAEISCSRGTWYGTKNVGINIKNSKPFLHWSNPRFNQLIFGQTYDSTWSGYREKLKGLGLEFLFESSPQVHHTLSWEGVWRDLKCLSPSTPFLIREEAGHSVKSSIKHIMRMDQRDSRMLPTRGSYFQLYQEYAGLGGTESFIKNEFHYQFNKSVWRDLVLQGNFMLGHVRSIGADKSVKINDRFFLGGPLSLRGFGMHGVGPQSQGYFLGAESYLAAGLHIFAPLPFRPLRESLDKFCRLHLFLNTGNIGNFVFTEDYHQNIMELLSGLRWSYGIGLAFALSNLARLEINYALPLSSQPGDKLSGGLQFGIGMEFL